MKAVEATPAPEPEEKMGSISVSISDLLAKRPLIRGRVSA